MDWTAFRLTLELAFWTCLLIVPIAIALARALAWGRFAGQSFVQALIMLPLVLPPTVLGFYLLVAFSPEGTTGAVLAAVFGEPLVFTFAGILVASIIINLPFAVQPIQRSFEAIQPNVREAAFVSGLSPFDTMRKIELPLAWPGIVSAIALVMAHTLGEFGVILMIGGSIPGETRVMSISIYDAVQAFRGEDAAVMSAVLLAFSFIAIALVHVFGQRPRAERHER